MAKAINDDICIQGSTLLLNAGNLTVKYYIINTE